MRLCDGCYEEGSGLVGECQDVCNLRLDHAGLCDDVEENDEPCERCRITGCRLTEIDVENLDFSNCGGLEPKVAVTFEVTVTYEAELGYADLVELYDAEGAEFPLPPLADLEPGKVLDLDGKWPGSDLADALHDYGSEVDSSQTRAVEIVRRK